MKKTKITSEKLMSLQDLKNLHTEMKAKQILTKEDLERVSRFIKDVHRSGMMGRFNLKGDKYYFEDGTEVYPNELIDINDKVGVRDTLNILMKDKGCKALLISYPMTDEDINTFKGLKFLQGKDIKWKVSDFNLRGFWVEPTNPKDQLTPDNSTERVEMTDGSEKVVSVTLYRAFRALIANKLNLRVGEVTLKKKKIQKKRK